MCCGIHVTFTYSPLNFSCHRGNGGPYSVTCSWYVSPVTPDLRRFLPTLAASVHLARLLSLKHSKISLFRLQTEAFVELQNGRAGPARRSGPHGPARHCVDYRAGAARLLNQQERRLQWSSAGLRRLRRRPRRPDRASAVGVLGWVVAICSKRGWASRRPERAAT